MSLGPWADRLQPASWRGLPFVVAESRIARGRRTALHQYPFRDTVFVEDLGRGVREYTFRGFVIGDDVYDQRDRFVSAAELPGPGALVHPSLGTIQASLLSFAAGERRDLGRVVELDFSFIENGNQLFPDQLTSTRGTVLAQYASGLTAVAADFQSKIAPAIALGTEVVAPVLATVQQWTGLARSLVGDAALVQHAVSGLVPTLGAQFGRFLNVGLVTSLPSTATVASQLALATTNRAALLSSATNVETQWQALSASSDPFSPAAAALAESLRLAASSPADQIRLLTSLATFSPTVMATTDPLGSAINTMTTAMAAVARRSALSSLAVAASNYRPTSYQDAVTVEANIAALFDAETVISADGGDTQSYMALKNLRASVSLDLETRGAQVPALVTFTFNTPLPSLVLAYRLYRDAGREAELVERANAIHPAFMPVTFQALAS